MSYVEPLQPKQVTDVRTLCRYVQQQLGTPYPSGSQIKVAASVANRFLEENPGASWHTLTKVALWAKAKKRRPATVHTLISWSRLAWAAGYLPELDPTDGDPVDREIAEAMDVERDPEWRRRLLACQGASSRRSVLQAWRDRRLVTH